MNTAQTCYIFKNTRLDEHETDTWQSNQAPIKAHQCFIGLIPVAIVSSEICFDMAVRANVLRLPLFCFIDDDGAFVTLAKKTSRHLPGARGSLVN